MQNTPDSCKKNLIWARHRTCTLLYCKLLNIKQIYQLIFNLCLIIITIFLLLLAVVIEVEAAAAAAAAAVAVVVVVVNGRISKSRRGS